MQTADIMDQKIRASLEVELLEVINESSAHQMSPEGRPGARAQTHFRLLIVSKDFEGLSTVNRHRKVYQILSEELKNGVHALCQQTFTPKEWQSVSSAPLISELSEPPLKPEERLHYSSSAIASSPPCHRKNLKNRSN